MIYNYIINEKHKLITEVNINKNEANQMYIHEIILFQNTELKKRSFIWLKENYPELII